MSAPDTLTLASLRTTDFAPGQLGVLGDPIAHSLSPAMHNAAIATLLPTHPRLAGAKPEQGQGTAGQRPDQDLRTAHQRGGVAPAQAAQCELELEVAERLQRMIPAAELVRFNNSATEVVLSALRLARAHTGRKLILRFEGHYHGWADEGLVGFANPAASWGDDENPARTHPSKGVIPEVLDQFVVARWNDPDHLRQRVVTQRPLSDAPDVLVVDQHHRDGRLEVGPGCNRELHHF